VLIWRGTANKTEGGLFEELREANGDVGPTSLFPPCQQDSLPFKSEAGTDLVGGSTSRSVIEALSVQGQTKRGLDTGP